MRVLLRRGTTEDESVDVLILRLLHILAGAFWVGAVFTTVAFLQPTALAVGPAAGPFQAHLVRNRRFALTVLASAAVTVAAGLWLLWISTNGLDPAIALHESHLGFTLGGVVAILTFALGASFVYPRTVRVAGIVAGMLAEGRPPTADEQARLGTMRRQLTKAGWVVVVGLTISVAAMATARYWPVVL
jgi:hypothetical protein